MSNHVFHLFGEVNEGSAKELVEWLTSLEDVSPQNIDIYISSEGGQLDYAIAIINAMRSSSHKITVIGTGQVMSAAFLIFIHGHTRVLYENTEIMCHQYSWGQSGNHNELINKMPVFERTHARMVRMIKNCSNSRLSDKKISEKLLKGVDTFLLAGEVEDLGLCDKVIDIYEAKNAKK